MTEFKMIIDRETLQGLSSFLTKSTNELNVKIQDGITVGYYGLEGFDGAYLHIPKEAIKELQGEVVLGLDTQGFDTIINTFTDEYLELTVEGGAMLHIKGETQQSHIRLIDPTDTEEFKMVKADLPAKFDIKANELLSALKTASRNFSPQAIIEFDGDGKNFTVSSEKMTLGFKKKISVEGGKGTAGKASYQTVFLLDMLTGANGNIFVEIGNEMPIKFSYKIGNLEIQSFVAPRCGGD